MSYVTFEIKQCQRQYCKFQYCSQFINFPTQSNQNLLIIITWTLPKINKTRMTWFVSLTVVSTCFNTLIMSLIWCHLSNCHNFNINVDVEWLQWFHMTPNHTGSIHFLRDVFIYYWIHWRFNDSSPGKSYLMSLSWCYMKPWDAVNFDIGIDIFNIDIDIEQLQWWNLRPAQTHETVGSASVNRKTLSV